MKIWTLSNRIRLLSRIICMVKFGVANIQGSRDGRNKPPHLQPPQCERVTTRRGTRRGLTMKTRVHIPTWRRCWELVSVYTFLSLSLSLPPAPPCITVSSRFSLAWILSWYLPYLHISLHRWCKRTRPIDRFDLAKFYANNIIDRNNSRRSCLCGLHRSIVLVLASNIGPLLVRINSMILVIRDIQIYILLDELRLSQL